MNGKDDDASAAAVAVLSKGQLQQSHNCSEDRFDFMSTHNLDDNDDVAISTRRNNCGSNRERSTKYNNTFSVDADNDLGIENNSPSSTSTNNRNNFYNVKTTPTLSFSTSSSCGQLIKKEFY